MSSAQCTDDLHLGHQRDTNMTELHGPSLLARVLRVFSATNAEGNWRSFQRVVAAWNSPRGRYTTQRPEEIEPPAARPVPRTPSPRSASITTPVTTHAASRE